MKTRALMLVAALTTVTLAVPPKPDIKREIKDAYAGYAKAVMDKNIDAVMASLTDDVIWIEKPGEKMERPAVRAQMEGMFKQMPPGAKFWFTFKDIKVNSPTEAVAVVESHFQAPGKPEMKPPKGAPTRVWRDTWVKTGDKWQNKLGVVEIWPTPKPKS